MKQVRQSAATAEGTPLIAVNAAGRAHTIITAAVAVCLVRARPGRVRNLEILGHALLPPDPLGPPEAIPAAFEAERCTTLQVRIAWVLVLA
jgi:hypothetical protein